MGFAENRWKTLSSSPREVARPQKKSPGENAPSPHAPRITGTARPGSMHVKAACARSGANTFHQDPHKLMTLQRTTMIKKPANSGRSTGGFSTTSIFPTISTTTYTATTPSISGVGRKERGEFAGKLMNGENTLEAFSESSTKFGRSAAEEEAMTLESFSFKSAGIFLVKAPIAAAAVFTGPTSEAGASVAASSYCPKISKPGLEPGTYRMSSDRDRDSQLYCHAAPAGKKYCPTMVSVNVNNYLW